MGFLVLLAGVIICTQFDSGAEPECRSPSSKCTGWTPTGECCRERCCSDMMCSAEVDASNCQGTGDGSGRLVGGRTGYLLVEYTAKTGDAAVIWPLPVGVILIFFGYLLALAGWYFMSWSVQEQLARDVQYSFRPWIEKGIAVRYVGSAATFGGSDPAGLVVSCPPKAPEMVPQNPPQAPPPAPEPYYPPIESFGPAALPQTYQPYQQPGYHEPDEPYTPDLTPRGIEPQWDLGEPQYQEESV